MTVPLIKPWYRGGQPWPHGMIDSGGMPQLLDLETDWDMANPGITIEEDQTGGAPSDGVNFGYLPDRSQKNNFLAQITASKRPQWNASVAAFGNKPTATFATELSVISPQRFQNIKSSAFGCNSKTEV